MKLSEAKGLCKKALETLDETKKTLYMNKAVLGTLYVVPNYIARNNLSTLSSRIYDINDIINTFNEVWIKKVRAGELLNVTKYADVFSKSYFNEVCANLIGYDIDCNETFDLPIKFFEKMFYTFIQFKNKGETFSYKDLVAVMAKDRYYMNLLKRCDSSIMLIFESIYNNLNDDKKEELDIGIRKIDNFLKAFIDIGISESISNCVSSGIDMESDIINQLFFTAFIKDVDNTLIDERKKQIIHQRYGIDDGSPETYEEIGEVYNISSERVRQLTTICLRTLRNPENKIQKYF
ncbi:hypothetical protein EGP91_05005 [bacterium]|nr:hypothetical protein [bacterium]